MKRREETRGVDIEKKGGGRGGNLSGRRGKEDSKANLTRKIRRRNKREEGERIAGGKEEGGTYKIYRQLEGRGQEEKQRNGGERKNNTDQGRTPKIGMMRRKRTQTIN
jgi:hypothetical protein